MPIVIFYAHWVMYRAMVRRAVRRVYQHLSEGDFEPVVTSFSSNAEFVFAGDHAMGGYLQGRQVIRQWFARTFRLLPDLQLVPHMIVASGPPWNTQVATRFTATASLPGDVQYRNEGMQYLRIRWGRVIEDRLYEDTQALVVALEVLAAHGAEEAAAAPLGPVTRVARPDDMDPSGRRGVAAEEALPS